MAARLVPLLWHSVAPWSASAYGVQTRLVTHALRERGHRIWLSGAAGANGGELEWEGFRVLPAPSRVPGSLATWIDQLEADDSEGITITLIDCWRLQSEPLRGRRVLSWIPVDGSPVPDATVQHFRSTGNTALAMTATSAAELTAAGIHAVHVPCAIDPTVFHPLDEATRARVRTRARARWGLPTDAYVVGVVAANGDRHLNRKCLPETIEAVGRWTTNHDDVVLHLHTDVVGSVHGGMDLRPILSRWEKEGLRWTAPDMADLLGGLADSEMADLYHSFDVLLSASGAEGFGVPLLEAQASGVPVIASDFGAQRDHVFAGRLVSGQERWIAELGSWFFTPSVDEILSALDAVRGRWFEPTSFSPVEEFHIQSVMQKKWLELLE